MGSISRYPLVVLAGPKSRGPLWATASIGAAALRICYWYHPFLTIIPKKELPKEKHKGYHQLLKNLIEKAKMAYCISFIVQKQWQMWLLLRG